MAAGRFCGPLAGEFAAFAATLEASATASKTTLTQLRALDRYTAQRGLPSGTIDENLAKAWLADCATRAPNTRRAHTTALHLLQSGAELNVIKSWLGHVSITTTSEYIEIDMAMKRKAIERCAPPAPGPEGESRWHASKDIIQWLEDL